VFLHIDCILKVVDERNQIQFLLRIDNVIYVILWKMNTIFYLLECSLYTNLRCQYIPRYFRFRPNMQTLIELITNENSVIIKHLGIYVCKAFELNHSNRY